MRFLRSVFLLLLAVGICGAVYFGLYAGLRLSGFALAAPKPETRPARTGAGDPAQARSDEPEDPQALLQRRLNTPKPDPATAGVAASAPQPAPSAAIVPMPQRTWLPQPESLTKPRPLPGEGLRPPRAAPTAEVPPLADGAALVPPVPVRLAVPPALPVPSPDPAQVPVDSAATRAPAFDRPQVTTDPTLEHSRRLAVAAKPPLRQTPAPFLKLSIPDPSPAGGPADAGDPPPDDDAPVSPPGTPGRVTLK